MPKKKESGGKEAMKRESKDLEMKGKKHKLNTPPDKAKDKTDMASLIKGAFKGKESAEKEAPKKHAKKK
jgi:hypothetical protein